jgi:hypothetical protein
MKIPRATLAATAIPLLLTSLPLTAGELPFNAPDTARAQENAQLLHQAARALGDLPATSTLAARDRHISKLWIFPTADADTVFAQYELSSNEEGGASTKHLTVLQVRGDRILEQRELTDARAYSVSDDERPSATLHWSASIGTGHVFGTDATTSSHGVPANAHWTSRIGTGAAASSVSATESKQPSSSKSQSSVADAHWTSKIGTGHATESNGRERI